MNQNIESGGTEPCGRVNNEATAMDDVLTHVGIERIFNITNKNQINTLLKYLHSISTHDDFKQCIKLARMLCSEIDNGYQIENVIKSLQKVHVDTRNPCVLQILPLIRENNIINGYQISRVLNVISQVMHDSEFVTDVMPFFRTNKLNGNQIADVLTRMIAISADHRKQVVDRSISRITRRCDNLTIEDIIAILENEMLGDRQATSILGSDVHSSGREQRTREAVELLYNHKALTSNEINIANNECCVYIEHKFDGACKILDELMSAMFDFKGMHFVGSHFIAHIWNYAQFADDADFAKQSFVTALKESRDVCYDGKIQRLVIAVLQGRLPGVDIEILDHQIADWNTYLTDFNFKHPYLMKQYFATPQDTTLENECLKYLALAADKYCIDQYIWLSPFWHALTTTLSGDDE